MQIGKKFNRLSISEYHHYIANHKKYTDFNTLGLYRSILENEKLNTKERIALRDHSNITFGKFYKFLQLKDPITFKSLSTLGMEMTLADEKQVWENIRIQQQKILKDKRIRHRNFGTYSKHNCVESCYMNGMMVRADSPMAEDGICFNSDHNSWSGKEKSQRLKKERKNMYSILQTETQTDAQ